MVKGSVLPSGRAEPFYSSIVVRTPTSAGTT